MPAFLEFPSLCHHENKFSHGLARKYKTIERRNGRRSKVRVGVHRDVFSFSTEPVVDCQSADGENNDYQSGERQTESDKVLKVPFEGMGHGLPPFLIQV